MHRPDHSFLIDLLAAHEHASCHGCGLEPRLLDLLLERHGDRRDVIALPRPIRMDGPAQSVPDDSSRLTAPIEIAKKRVHVGR